ncbi:MAG TPA: RsmG family class I SAM-dependent methyltransferase, partial [Candidatus Paceibacterota bacterium]
MQSLADLARDLGVELSAAQLNAFDIYSRELVAWNARMNLTSITDPEQVTVKHFLDSLSSAPLIRAALPLDTANAAPSLVDV